MKKFVCSVCGYVHEGDQAPEKCPQCKVPAEKFVEQKGEILHRHGLDFCSIDLVMNLYDREELLRRLRALLDRDALRVMIHEQYFYSDYHAYQPDFGEKLDQAFSLLHENGYESCFAEEF